MGSNAIAAADSGLTTARSPIFSLDYLTPLLRLFMPIPHEANRFRHIARYKLMLEPLII